MLGRLPSEYSGGLLLNTVHSYAKVTHNSIGHNRNQIQETIDVNNDPNTTSTEINPDPIPVVPNQVDGRPSCIRVPSLLSPKSTTSKTTRGPLKTISFLFSTQASPTRNEAASDSNHNREINTSNDSDKTQPTTNTTTTADVHISVPVPRSMIVPLPSANNTDALASSRSSSRSCDVSMCDHDAVLEIEEFIQIEYDVFYNLLLIVDKRGKLCMTNLWSVSGLSQIKLRAYQFDCLCKYIVPKLHAHFNDIQLQPEVLVAQWFITLFSYTVPLRTLMKLWDHIFVHGWAGVRRLCIYLFTFHFL